MKDILVSGRNKPSVRLHSLQNTNLFLRSENNSQFQNPVLALTPVSRNLKLKYFRIS